MYATIQFDTEDVYYPPQHRIDDIPGWLAQTMSEVGVRGTFLIFGEKVRSLMQRGRKDVLDKMAAHDVISHQMGNVRPLVPEALQHCGWADGVAAMEAYEDAVAEEFRKAFGREPAGMSRHNLYWAPQHIAVAGRRKLPYAYGVLGAGAPQPTWYAGALNLPCSSHRSFGGFDSIYSCDDAFEAKLRELGKFLDEAGAGGAEFVSVFGCHPVRVMARGWIEEYCLAGGATRTPAQLGWLYSVKTPQEEAVAQANFRRLVKCLHDRPDVEMVGMAEAGKLFSSQPAEISRDELTEYAEQVERAARPLLHRTFSPAELLAGLSESILHAQAHGDIPYAAPRRDVLGPTSLPTLAREVDLLSHEQLVELCRQVSQAIASTGHLPANVQTPAGKVGAGQLLLLAGRSYLALARHEKLQQFRVACVPRYPEAAMEIDAWVRRSLGEHWPYGLEFTCDRIAEHARLQTWTLKPAWLRPPRGQAYSEGRIHL